MINEIYQLEIELSTKCNARCPQCSRNYFGSYTWPTLPLVDLDFNTIKNSISHSTWNNLKHIKFCGTYGDPCMHKDLIEIIKWVKSNSPASITINTNGGIRSKKWWSNLAEILNPLTDKVFFGIDGLDDTNHLHRIGVDYSKVIKNLRAFNDAGGHSVWSFLVFKHNQHQVPLAEKTAKLLGCKNFVWKSTSRFLNKAHQLIKFSPVLNDQGQKVYVLNPTTDNEYKNAGYDDYIKVSNEYQSYNNYSKVAKIECKALKQQIVYISAEGDVFPCGWLSDRMYGYEAESTPDHKLLLDIIETIGGKNKINLHYSKFEDIIHGEWFSIIEQKRNTNQLYRCAFICGTESTLIEKANTQTSKVWAGKKL